MASLRSPEEKEREKVMAKKNVGYDLGHKMEEDMPMSKKICYPSVHLTEEELPLLEETEVGDKVSFLCLFEVTSMRKEKDGKACYDLDLLKVAEDAEMKMSKALEEFMGEHKEVEEESEKGEKTEKGEKE